LRSEIGGDPRRIKDSSCAAGAIRHAQSSVSLLFAGGSEFRNRNELGFLPVDKRGADLLFQVVAARYEAGSIVITTNRPFKDWGAIFDVDATLATALIDRLMHHGEVYVIRGGSYRMKGKDTPPEPPN
jgi:hypothetical protein